ncbi:MAG: hypothetical protein WCG83_02680 [Candidatus Peregrinibacteria bacterium]
MSILSLLMGDRSTEKYAVSSMQYAVLFLVVMSCCLFVLSSCSFITGPKTKVLDTIGTLTASGAEAAARLKQNAEAAVTLGKSAVEGVANTVKDVQERAAKVQSGVTMIQQGKKLIEEGVAR